MILDERDIALGIEHRTRQLRAEKHLQMLPSEQEQSWSEWCNLLHDQWTLVPVRCGRRRLI
jgi:hypothetical protein